MVTKRITQTDFYTYRITWSDEDGEYVGLCAEFPGLSWLDISPESALHGIRNLVKETIIDMQTNNEKIPQPLTNKRYSGKFLVRVPPEVHKRITIEAAEAKVSINRLVSAKLSER